MIRDMLNCDVYNRKTNKIIANIKTKSIYKMRKFINKYGYNNEDKYYLKFKEAFEKYE